MAVICFKGLKSVTRALNMPYEVKQHVCDDDEQLPAMAGGLCVELSYLSE